MNISKGIKRFFTGFVGGALLIGGLEWAVLNAIAQTPNMSETTSKKKCPTLLVQGTIYKNDKIELDRWDPLGKHQPNESHPGNYSIECVNSIDEVLSKYSFDVSWEISYSSQNLWTISTSSVGFGFVVPYPNDTKRVVIKHLNNVLAERVRSANTPTININPIKYLPDGKIELSWTAADKDKDDKLFYDVFYSNDGGKNYVPLKAGLPQEQTNLSIDTKKLPGGTDCLFLVDVSDNLNEAEVKSEIFSVLTHLPVAKITRPYENSEFILGKDTIFSGEGFDYDDRELKDDALAWRSNIDGKLGKGRDIKTKLSRGEHIITLEAQDSEGNVATYSRKTKVANDERPDISIYDVKFEPMKINKEGGVLEGRIYVELFNTRKSALANVKVYVNEKELEIFPHPNVINNKKELWHIQENNYTSVWAECKPPASGKYNVRVVVSDAEPEESNVTNNQKESTITVPKIGLPPRL